MIRCIIIDDEPLALGQLKSYVAKVPFLELVASCQDAFEATRIISQQQVDAVFVDINMPDVNGLDFVRSLVERPLVVFTTAYSEYALESYQVDAVDYLLKPFSLQEFQRAANKLRKQFELISSVPKDELNEEKDILFVKSEYKIVKLNLKDIRYVEGMSEYLRIFIEGEAKPVITLLSMKKLEDYLPKNTFMRVHRSYIVNLKKIQEVARLRIVMDKNTYIPVSDLYKEQFYDFLNNKFICK